jgi:tetratricopeptide (TPR) repeat protein
MLNGKQTFITAGLVLLLLSCSGEPPKIHVKDGRQYGQVEGAFRHKWWNYYERALSYMEGEFYEAALADLEKASGRRFADKRRARTYGLHFVDYFPHRERGLIYYLTGKYELAQKELELSLAQEPSAKARFYRDKIRRILLEKTEPIVSSPVILVDLPADEIWVKEDPIVISGTAQDKQYISGITLAGAPFFLENSRQKAAFSESFKLAQGRHVVNIVAENLLGGTSTREIVIHVDRQGPIISLEFGVTDTGGPKQVRGYLYDDSGEISLSVDGVPVTVPPGEDVPFAAPVALGAKQMVLVAKDKLGNQTRAEIDLESMTASRRYELLAANEYAGVVNDAGGLLAFSIGKSDDRDPVVNLAGWAEAQTVFMEKVFIEGNIRDESNIVDITINGVPVLRRKGRVVFFNHLLDLKEGENSVRIQAVDEHDNTALKEITITREVPLVFQIGSRFSVTLFPFNKKGISTGMGDMYEGLFFVRLMDQDRFQLIERARLDTVLEEQKLSQTKLIDEATALEMGRLVAARATLVGDFIETRLGIEVVARIIDNETSEILAIKDVYDEVGDRAALMDLAEGLAIKFHREFPLLDGMIVQNKGGSFYSDLGKGKIKPRRRLIIYREGEPVRNPKTGEVLGADTEVIGFARVTQVMDKMSKAILLGGLKEKDIKVQDKVITE